MIMKCMYAFIMSLSLSHLFSSWYSLIMKCMHGFNISHAPQLFINICKTVFLIISHTLFHLSQLSPYSPSSFCTSQKSYHHHYHDRQHNTSLRWIITIHIAQHHIVSHNIHHKASRRDLDILYSIYYILVFEIVFHSWCSEVCTYCFAVL